MSKLTIHWRLAAEPEGPEQAEVAHFFLYREGDEVHCDHRHYTRDELERRVDGIRAGAGAVPVYYEEALEALEDPLAPRQGEVALDTTD